MKIRPAGTWFFHADG